MSLCSFSSTNYSVRPSDFEILGCKAAARGLCREQLVSRTALTTRNQFSSFIFGAASCDHEQKHITASPHERSDPIPVLGPFNVQPESEMVGFISTSKLYISTLESTMLASSYPSDIYPVFTPSKFSPFSSLLYKVPTQPLVGVASCPCAEPSNDATSYCHRNMRTFNSFTLLAVFSCIAIMAEAAYPRIPRDGYVV